MLLLSSMTLLASCNYRLWASSVFAVAVLLMIAYMLLLASMRWCFFSAEAGVPADASVTADAGVPTAVDFAVRYVLSSDILSFLLSVCPSVRRSVYLSVCPSVCLSTCPSGCLLSAVCGLTNWNQPPFLQQGLLEDSSGPKNLQFPAHTHQLFKIPTSDFSQCAERGFVRWRGKIFITHVGSMAGSLNMRLIGRG